MNPCPDGGITLWPIIVLMWVSSLLGFLAGTWWVASHTQPTIDRLRERLRLREEQIEKLIQDTIL